MSITFAIVLGLLAALALAGAALGLSFPAARAVMKKPAHTRHGLVFRFLLSSALIGGNYLLHPHEFWLHAVMLGSIFGGAAMYWLTAVRQERRATAPGASRE